MILLGTALHMGAFAWFDSICSRISNLPCNDLFQDETIFAILSQFSVSGISLIRFEPTKVWEHIYTCVMCGLENFMCSHKLPFIKRFLICLNSSHSLHVHLFTVKNNFQLPIRLYILKGWDLFVAFHFHFFYGPIRLESNKWMNEWTFQCNLWWSAFVTWWNFHFVSIDYSNHVCFFL